MAKGYTCPNCDEKKFHKVKAVYVCSNCKAVGWDKTPGSAGAGKGSKCNSCSNHTVKVVHEDKKRNFKVYFCSECKATYIL